MSQFSRGREAMEHAKAARQLRQQLVQQNLNKEPQPAVYVLATDAEGKQRLVGTALTDEGARKLVNSVGDRYPGCRFTVQDTLAVLF